MNTLRLLLLLALLVLLPLRGLQAATPPCAPADADGCAVVAMHHATAAAHRAMSHGNGAEHCAACCAADLHSPLVASLFSVAAPALAGKARFSPPALPPLSFIASTLERPPRIA